MTLYQLSSRACNQPTTLQLLRRQYQIGDAVLILESLSNAQLGGLKAQLSEFDCYQLVLTEDGPTQSGNQRIVGSGIEALSTKGWLDLITQADRTVTL